MSNKIANIVLVSSNDQFAQTITDSLKKNSFNVSLSNAKDVESFAASHHPDLIAFDCSSNDFDGFDLIAKLKANTDTRTIPCIALAAATDETAFEKALMSQSDDIFAHDTDIQELLLHIKPLLRLSTMFSELDMRVELARDLGIAADATVTKEDGDYRILLINPQPGDKATVETVLDGKCEITTSDNFFDAEELLGDGQFDAILCSNDTETQEQVLSLASRIRNNPRLFNLPFLSVCEGTSEQTTDIFRRGITRQIQRPLNQAQAKYVIKTLVRRQRLRWAVRNAMDSTRGKQSMDDVTKSYNKEFFITNLERQIDGAQKWNKYLTTVFFAIPNIPNIEKQFGKAAGEQLLQQVCQWISSLTRVEDVVARYGMNEFCITLPDTPLGEAQIVMHRIAGILSYTDFALDEVYQPISVWVEYGLAQMDSSDTAQSMIERARTAIDTFEH